MSFCTCAKRCHVDLGGMPALKTIGASAFYGCAALVSANLQRLTRVEHIYSNFMFQCVALPAIDLSHLTALKTIESAGFAELSLTSVNLRGLVSMEDCEAPVAELGSDFLVRCNPSVLDLSDMKKLRNIWASVFHGCSSLTSINLSGLVNLEEIGAYFMFKCAALSSIDLSHVKKLNKIGIKAFYGCAALQSAKLTCLDTMEEVGEAFRKDCTRVPAADLAKFKALKKTASCK
jgi:hypothetical protein